MTSKDFIYGVYGGHNRRLYKYKCKQCGSEFYRPKHLKNKYCSYKCVHLSQTTRIEVTCDYCGKNYEKQLHRLRDKNFCCRRCKDASQVGSVRPEIYVNGISSYRAKALSFYGEKCLRCGFSGNIDMLHVHHIDSDRTNNNMNNLEILCVTCHKKEHRRRYRPTEDYKMKKGL